MSHDTDRSLVRRVAARLRLARSGDAGIAMIMVMASITILSLLVTAALGYALSAQPQARRDQDWNAALTAAQAGVDDFIARLNQNDSYWQSIDCTNLAEKGPAAGTNTCGWTSATPVAWQSIAASNPNAGSFHYDIDTSVIYSQGAVRLTSTGKSRSATRSIQVLVSRGGSTDFLYYTDFEDADPGNTNVYPTGPSTDTCGKSGPTLAKYWWQAGYNRTGCTEINFVTGDVLDGAVHFNDTPLINGSTVFKKGYETADPACKTGVASNGYAACWRGAGVPNLNGNKANYVGQLNLPDNSDQFATYPGCKYKGDTRIKFNSDGTMTVWSYGSTGALGTGCGNSAAAWPQTVQVPTDQTIYVANGTTQAKCNAGQVGDGIPLANDVNRNVPTFYCGNGNIYIEGTLSGRVTVAAQNNIIVTGDLLLNGTASGSSPVGNDILGLVSSNSVVNYHPVDTSGNSLTTINDRWVYASIQTLQHSFWVQSYDQGNKLGTLHVRGSIAQKWRGIVGTGGASGTGYLKDYGYDTRLKFVSPPYFPQWTNAVWGAKTTAELKPAY